ncbi:hypothetical protein VE00_09740 [Pseudogymnoascus sp. WSF 3629]|nr:hypothetical protein VE00_09740 [Pseudogymnoascus sp. WSF 3629]
MRFSIIAFLGLSSSLAAATICPLKVPVCCFRYNDLFFHCKDPERYPTDLADFHNLCGSVYTPACCTDATKDVDNGCYGP